MLSRQERVEMAAWEMVYAVITGRKTIMASYDDGFAADVAAEFARITKAGGPSVEPVFPSEELE